jgi:signal peptidase I
VVAARAIREVVLWVAAAIGVLCLLVAAAAVLLHVTPLVFRSGSMSPGIPTGSVGLAQPVEPSAVRVGQIVSVVLPDGTRVTHRVHDVVMQGDAARITLKGDANAKPDPVPVVTTSIDRVFWSTPELGYVLEGASRPAVVFVGGALLGMIAMWGFRRPALLPGEEPTTDAVEDTDSETGRGTDAHAGTGLEARGAVTTSAPVSGLEARGPVTTSAPASGLEARGPVTTSVPVSGLEARGHGSRPAPVAHSSGPRHAMAGVRWPGHDSSSARGHRAGHVALLVAGGVVVALGASITLGVDPASAAPWTDPVAATTPSLQAGTILPAASFTCSATNGIALTWQPPAAGSVPVQSWRIDVANSGLGANLPSSGNLAASTTSYNYTPAMISLLTVGNTYTFTLSASNGNWSAATAKSATVLLSLVWCN